MPFADSMPAGGPQDILTGFLNEDGDAMGRPVGVVADATGALQVDDDVGNTVWRVVPEDRAEPTGNRLIAEIRSA